MVKMYNYIYKIAREASSFEDLGRKLEGLDIDAPKEGNPYLTVATQLAIEGRVDRVDWLRRLGADINLLVQGHAIAGNHEQVEVCRKRHGAHVDSIARGYALAGNLEQVEVYRRDHKALVDAIANGHAVAGNHEQVKVYRSSYEADVHTIAYGYALARNLELVEYYRLQHSIKPDWIAYSHAAAGNHKQVEVYLKQHGANVKAVADGYELAGNYGKQIKYSITITSLLDSYIRERTAKLNHSGNTKEYFYGRFFSCFQKSFIQKGKAVHALEQALEGREVNLSEHLSTLRNGKLGQELREFIKSGMANQLVNKNVNTVSDFVQALQEKISKRQGNRPPPF
jgi:hypothetical protein